MIYIRYNNGRVLQGVVLAFGDGLVRVAVKDCDDAVEFRLVSQVWVSEDCEVVKLDFEVTVDPLEGEESDLLETLLSCGLQPVSILRVM
jgi:hypothetical protein